MIFVLPSFGYGSAILKSLVALRLPHKTLKEILFFSNLVEIASHHHIDSLYVKNEEITLNRVKKNSRSHCFIAKSEFVSNLICTGGRCIWKGVLSSNNFAFEVFLSHDPSLEVLLGCHFRAACSTVCF